MALKCKKQSVANSITGDSVERLIVVPGKKLNINDIAREMQETTGVAAISTLSVLRLFSEYAREALLRGDTVLIDDLGSLSLSVTRNNKGSREARANFRAATPLRKALVSTTLEVSE